MSGPWEQYGSNDGPWNDYGSKAAAPQPDTSWQDIKDDASSLGRNFLAGVEEAPGAMQHLVGSAFGDPNAAAYAPKTTGIVAHATGFDPQTVPATSFFDKVARGLGQSAPMLPFGAESLPINLARGTGAVTGSTAAQEVVPDRFKPVAGLVGGLLGGSPEIAVTPFAAARNALLRPDANAAARMADFTAAGVPPPGASSVLGNRNAAYLESALSHMPGGANVYSNAMGNTLDALKGQMEGATKLISGNGAQTAEQAGNVIQKGIQSASERMKARQEKLYTDALSPVLETPLAKRPLPAMEQLSQDLTKELGAAPESLSNTAGSALNKVNAVLRDAAGGDATLDTLRRIRTDVGRDIQDPLLAGVSSSQQPFLKRMYGALTSDINDVAMKSDPTGTVQKGLATADRYTRLNSGKLEFLDSFLGSKQADQVYNSALTSGKGGGATLQSIRRTLKPEEWDQVAGTVLGRMGLAKPGAQAASGIADTADTFSPATFMTNWSSMSPEAKQALFGGTRYQKLAPSLERLVRVTQNVRDFQKLEAGSPTFERGASGALFGTMATLGATNLIHGNVINAIGEPALAFFGGYVAPKIAAKYMTNPQFIDRLANRISAKTPAARAKADNAIRSMFIGAMNGEENEQ